MKKRFLASIVCPVCNEIDKIHYTVKDKVQYTECIACGDTQSMPPEGPEKNSQTHAAQSAPLESTVKWFPKKTTKVE